MPVRPVIWRRFNWALVWYLITRFGVKSGFHTRFERTARAISCCVGTLLSPPLAQLDGHIGGAYWCPPPPRVGLDAAGRPVGPEYVDIQIRARELGSCTPIPGRGFFVVTVPR